MNSTNKIFTIIFLYLICRKSRKGRKGKTPAVPDSKEKDKKTQTGGKTQGQGSDRTPKSQGGPKGHEGEKGPGSDRPESHATEKSDTQPEEGRYLKLF